MERQLLVDKIIDHLHRDSYYLTHLRDHERQALADFEWAALLAGRAIGQKTSVFSKPAEDTLDLNIVVVALRDAVDPASDRPVLAALADGYRRHH